ncbi:hypothetical protein FACS189452_03590 [Bacteroidia bacterium]|nr:hypothetical protein FACS189452_03590 [Bacteroidia bacterium]
MQHKITALLFVLSIYAMPANAGVLYDFEDGTKPADFTFSQGSRWRITTQGLSGQYALCDSLLAGTAIAESFSFAVTPTRALADTFSCLLRFNYLSSTNVQQNTTNTNRFAIFIGANEGASDSTAIIFSSSPLEAFVLTFKGTSGDDTLRLYRKNKNTTLNPASATPIISTKTKVNGKLLAVQLIHLPNGVFRLSVGENGDFTNMQTDTSGVIVSGFAGNYIGIHLVTSLASNRKVIASIDDIKATFVLQPLEIDDLQQVNTMQLRVTFNKNIDDSDLLNLQNYELRSVDNVFSVADVQKEDNKSVLLTFATPFVSNSYTLFVQRMHDEFGNEESADKNIDIVISLYGDVVFSELMVKPADNVNFSDEYIELYNRTNHAVNLSGWTLDHSTQTVVLITSGTIPAQDYIMLNYSDTLCNVAKTSSHATLTDRGKQLTLRDPYGVMVARVTYSDTWYGDASKKDGGFSLEKIDLDNLEETAQNWTACPDERGGTPCGANAAVFVLQPLEIDDLQQINDTQLKVTFNKNIDDTYLLDSQNYELRSVGNVFPVVDVQKEDNKSVLLTFATPFVSNSYTLSAQRMRDEFGNEESADKNIDITVSHYGDVVFSELMVKPADNVNFSEEYIELYNRTNHAVNLSGWTLDHSTKTIVRITSGTIPAQGYIMLNYSDTLCNVAKTSSHATLTDKGKQLTLRNSYNVMVARVAYSDTWYGDASKNDGGFSLEKIDLDNLEETAQNWTACPDERGGTPCGVNAATANNADANLPRCLRYEIAGNTLTLTFNEAIATENLTPEKFVCEVGETFAVICSQEEPMVLKIIFANNFAVNQSYTLRIENAVSDLQGNCYETFELPIGIGVAPQAGDVVINEILFNPKTGGVDFVELYNISDKLVEMKNNKIANRKVATGDLDKAYRITDSYILQPRQFVVLCTQPDVVCEHYHCEQPDVFITIPTMPSYPNNEGCAAFLDSTGVTIDEFYYTEKMHISLLNSNKGVSLERINPLRLTNENANWFSASQVAGFATPTYQNSQYSSTENVNNQQVISISPEVFSPDGDGVDDVLFIDYVMPDFDYLANVYIYDVSGRLVRELHKNVLLGKDGRLMWDGVNLQGTQARIGIYVIVMEAHSQSGKTQVYKKTAVLGAKLGR